MTCEDDTVTAGTIAVLAAGVPQRGFREALAEVRKQGRPLTLDVAEAAMAELGGPEQLGKMIVQDLKRVRGDHIDDDLKQFHDPDYKVLRAMYDTLVKLAGERDKLVGETGDPLADVSESDLQALAAQAAILQLEVDAEFRTKILDLIIEIDPDAVLMAAGRALDKQEAGPKVEVVDGGDT